MCTKLNTSSLYQIKVKVAPLYILQKYNISARWRGVVSAHPGCFMPRKQHWYLLNRRLHGLQDQSGHLGEEKNLLPLSGFVPYTIQPVAYSVYRQSYSGSYSSKYIDEISFC
jgi:hypothetical protein